ncbi:MAG: metallophosphoesterase [Flavobacteriaceae bacterium]|jgi:metallophosphoesterase superfamily enzyme|nr:metallophosphoesterase [Flavobacteriaceae bacterium]
MSKKVSNKKVKSVGYRPRLTKREQEVINNLRNDTSNRVLVIGDVHAPFERKDYLKFCKETYKKYNCNTVVFIGDIIDSHYSSYHETDADGLGGAQELDLAIKSISKWYKAFPDAYVTVGNHDAIIMRKAQTSSIPSAWIKHYNDVLGTPNWKWVTDVVIDDVRYVHGHKSSKARTAAKRDMQSTVTGHYHTDMYVDWMFGANKAVFALAVGCGIDSRSYAMGYMQGGKKEALGCGVVLDSGQTPITVKMNLNE